MLEAAVNGRVGGESEGANSEPAQSGCTKSGLAKSAEKSSVKRVGLAVLQPQPSSPRFSGEAVRWPYNAITFVCLRPASSVRHLLAGRKQSFAP
jgi:hypothetical protein